MMFSYFKDLNKPESLLCTEAWGFEIGQRMYKANQKETPEVIYSAYEERQKEQTSKLSGRRVS